MKRMEKYNDVIINLLKSCEDALGVYNVVSNVKADKLAIVDYVSEMHSRKVESSKYLNISVQVGDFISSLSYCNCLFNFDRIRVVSFKSYIRIDLLAEILSKLMSKSDLITESSNCFLRLINYLQVQESKSMHVLSSLLYRLTRLVVTLILNRDYDNAHVVSRFILDQMFLSDDLDLEIMRRTRNLFTDSKEVENIASERMTPDKIKKAKETIALVTNGTDVEEQFKKKMRERLSKSSR